MIKIYFRAYLGKIRVLTNIFQLDWIHHLAIYLPSPICRFHVMSYYFCRHNRCWDSQHIANTTRSPEQHQLPRDSGGYWGGDLVCFLDHVFGPFALLPICFAWNSPAGLLPFHWYFFSMFCFCFGWRFCNEIGGYACEFLKSTVLFETMGRWAARVIPMTGYSHACDVWAAGITMHGASTRRVWKDGWPQNVPNTWSSSSSLSASPSSS